MKASGAEANAVRRGPTENINLLSDTQTRPSPGMREAIAAADVGDEQKKLDPTTIELQERVAELLGHEAGLYLPSGSMCNLIGLRLHIRPGGDEVILAANSHVAGFEAGAPATINGAMLRLLDAPSGIFEPADVEQALRTAGDRYAPRSRVVSVEQTTNMGGGRVWPVSTVKGVLDVARGAGLRAHMDGARLMNAAVASGVHTSAYAGGFDTAWLDFSKGLGAPVGAVLVGSEQVIEEAWRFKQMLGGAMRQSGVLAAACLYALEHNVDRLADDHSRARRLADGLAAIPGVVIDPGTVDTNIVFFEIAGAHEFCRRAAAQDVHVGAMGPSRVRAVTHLNVGDADVDRALEVLADVAC